jgi:ATP-dependent helicase Lhr and Lhr-like helicase
VQTAAGQALGSLSQEFVDRLVEDVSCFLLGGRPWVVMRIQHDDRRILVNPAPRGRQPTWGGYLPQFLGFELCQRMREVLLSDEAFPYLEPMAAAVLQQRRDETRELLTERQGIEIDEQEIRWWTFAGGRINATLRYALNMVNADWKVIPDNFLIKVRGDRLTRARFDEALAKLRSPEFWEHPQLWQDITASLPDYRLSKFQDLMPVWVVREVVGGYLVDVLGARGWVRVVFGTK